MDNIHMIYGAPGCGKTTRLLEILTKELEENEPNKIAFVSFTRKGTNEGVDRAKLRFGFKSTDLPYFHTLHSIAFALGKFVKYDIISKSDYKQFSEAMGMHFTGYYTQDFYANDDKYLFMHFLKRNNPKMAELELQNMNLHTLKEVEVNYKRFKEFKHVHDFSDIIEQFIERNEPLPVDIAIIDEAQDLTTLQWKMCEVAFRNCKKIYIAGDDDQAIYEWSGADVNYFLNINATTKEVLAKSYRLSKDILGLAKKVTKLISKRVDKQFDTTLAKGTVRFYNSLDDVELNNNETWYFLSRNNCFLSQYKTFLKQKARVFIDKEYISIDSRHIEAIKTFEMARRFGEINDLDEVKLKLYINGKPDLSKPWYDNVNFTNDQIAYYRDLIKFKTDLKDRKLLINTIHGVKGGEADNVVLMLDFTKAVALNMISNPDSELRCLYVAITRTKKNLHIIHSSTNKGYDNYVRLENDN